MGPASPFQSYLKLPLVAHAALGGDGGELVVELGAAVDETGEAGALVGDIDQAAHLAVALGAQAVVERDAGARGQERDAGGVQRAGKFSRAAP